jgi:pimeloyl-ACP methyl ester carboxylesterase
MKGLDVRTRSNLALASNIKSARLEWIGKARHASVIERPSEALAIMRNFLRG